MDLITINQHERIAPYSPFLKMTEYGSFEELEEFTELALGFILETPEKDRFDVFLSLLPDLRKSGKELHGLYQMIFFCLDNEMYDMAERLYRYMTGGESPLGDHSNAFICYCLHKNNLRSALKCLSLEIFDKDNADSIPYGRIVQLMDE